MSFYLDRAVTSRVSKFDYGVEISRVFVPGDPEYEKRKDNAYITASGAFVVGHQFSIVIPKVGMPSYIYNSLSG